ncbi:hypothetical protein [Psychrobacter sp. BI730]|uniref:hypothetical protein n=1 Tax=Psychrobacter sp. BI730 TaxID=2705463 RepID=UPI0015CA7C9A|nr:hypothetical protein [Psychrobacter sp. BI730]NYR09592.1 hypothetical protein [Psychrobacter sp. BI730]
MNIISGQVNNNLAEDFELGSKKTVSALVDELKYGASAYDKTDEHQQAVMVLLLRVIVRELSGFDIRDMTDKEIDHLAFRIAVATDVQRRLGDNGIIAIEDVIKELRGKQCEAGYE